MNNVSFALGARISGKRFPVQLGRCIGGASMQLTKRSFLLLHNPGTNVRRYRVSLNKPPGLFGKMNVGWGLFEGGRLFPIGIFHKG